MMLKPAHQNYESVHSAYLRAVSTGHFDMASRLHAAAQRFGADFNAPHVDYDIIASVRAAIAAWRYGHLNAYDTLRAIERVIAGIDTTAADF